MYRHITFAILSIITIALILALTVFKDKIKSAFYIDHMERDERVDRMNVGEILTRLNIKPGDYIADIGAGSGLFSKKFSEITASSGRVYAVDINHELLKYIDNVNSEKGINNIKTILAAEDDPRIPEPVDLIFICDTLHYIDSQKKYVITMSKYLKDGAG